MTHTPKKHIFYPSLKTLGLAFLLSSAPFSSALTRTNDEPPIFSPGAPGQETKTLSAKQSLNLAQSRYTPADVLFMQNMAIHHAQAVDMVALIEGRSVHKELTALGSRISLSQTSEIAMMHRWLKRRGEEISPPEGHGHMNHSMQKKEDHSDHNSGHKSGHNSDHDNAPSDQPLMTGMLSPVQMQHLAASNGRDFDYLFFTGMILHHQGAIDMVNNLLSEPDAAQDPVISEFTSSIVADQSAEILLMQTLLSELPN